MTPILFIGHGSPMNAIEENEYSLGMKSLKSKIPSPKAILVISAHWVTPGKTLVTHMSSPKTIHDFYGFPQELFQVQYNAPGAPELAEQIRESIALPKIELDDEIWGLDHGTWSILTHIYPEARIPVVQLSIDLDKPNEFHYELGQKLRFLRSQGVLILGSGNIVHNLREISWESDALPKTWALNFDEIVRQYALSRNFEALINEVLETREGRLSVPTLEHYVPLLYVLGASSEEDKLYFDIEGIQNSSISMRSFRFGGEICR